MNERGACVVNDVDTRSADELTWFQIPRYVIIIFILTWYKIKLQWTELKRESADKKEKPSNVL